MRANNYAVKPFNKDGSEENLERKCNLLNILRERITTIRWIAKESGISYSLLTAITSQGITLKNNHIEKINSALAKINQSI